MRAKQGNKAWNEIKTNDSWAIFKIMGEFVKGYEKLSQIGPCVSIFGSARTKPDHKYYKLTENGVKETASRMEELENFIRNMQNIVNPNLKLGY